MKHYSSSDNSDSEDLYAESETDDIVPSSDSELVSHSSDNEELVRSLSTSPVPQREHGHRHAIDSDDDDDDDEGALPTFSLSSQDFDQRTAARREQERRVQDGFFLVDQSDLEPPSRPHSSLSQHSDISRPEDSMMFIYPSMALSSSSEPATAQNGDVQEHATTNDSAQQRLFHKPSTHDIPTTIETSLETLSDKHSTTAQTEQQEGNSKDACTDNQPATDQTLPPPLSVATISVETAPLEPVSALIDGIEAGDAPVKPKLEFLNSHERTSIHAEKSEASLQPRVSRREELPTAVKALLDKLASEHQKSLPTPPGSIPINPSMSYIKVAAKCIGLLALLFLLGYSYAGHYHRSVFPAHVKVINVDYMEHPPTAVVHLSVFTTQLKQEQRPNRPPGFHIRVLNDNKPWSLAEAPPQSLHLLGEPILSCIWGGYCTVYIPLLQKALKKGPSPWLYMDGGSYYLHLWFANGTRAWNDSPEIFTNRGSRGRKPADDGEYEHKEEDDYMAYLRGQYQHLTSKVSEGYSSLSLSWTNIQWDHILPSIYEVQNMIHMALGYSQRSARILIDTVLQWKDTLARKEESALDRAKAALMRARQNAKKITSQTSFKMHQAADQIRDHAPFQSNRDQSSNIVEKQFNSFQKYVKAKLDRLSSSEFARKMDEFMLDVEEGLESLSRSKRVKKITRKVRSGDIQRQAQKIILEMEDQKDQLLETDVVRKLRRKMKKFMRRR
ncbi:hypothetical protein EDD11_004573 [Mortierella claussenii]|nr:hypothetical protein EDD11_004573 [Mortierella claussenii]